MQVRMRTFGAWSPCHTCTDANFWRVESMLCMYGCEFLARGVHVMHVRMRTFRAKSSRQIKARSAACRISRSEIGTRKRAYRQA